MQNISEGYKRAFKLFGDGLANIVMIGFLNMVVVSIIIVAMYVFVIIGGASLAVAVSEGIDTELSGIGVVIVVAMVAIIILIVYGVIAMFGAFMQGALLYTINDIARGASQKKLVEYLKLGWEKKWDLLGLSILMGIFVGVGMSFFIIPGVLVLIFSSFAFHVLLFEKTSLMQSFKRSYEIVKKNFWGYIGRIILFMLATMFISGVGSFIPFASIAIQLLVTGFVACYTYVLYDDMRSISLKEVN